MIDPKVFAELQNRGIITNVGLDSANYEDLADLKNRGLVTSIAANEEYDRALEMIEPSEEETKEEDIVVDDNE
jgi:hypothetical protein